MKTNKFFLRMVVYGIAGLISMASFGAAREILNKLKKINDFIEYSKFKSVSIIYDYSTDEWRINNKCDNNMIED